MSCDHMIHSPLIVIDKNSTILVEPDCKAEMTKKCDVTIMIGNGIPKHIGKELDAIQLSIFSHRNDLTSRSYRTRGWSRFQRSSHSSPPRGHAGCRALPDDGDRDQRGRCWRSSSS
ncbi:5-oxoprolinase-like isoform X1 [Clavelina lepadiformis]|uniref:5-oxoprolinase-like isoform X1 n=1 Tax=Clavelina lepadiformis TaxID=159417 RepID=UPI00404284B8